MWFGEAIFDVGRKLHRLKLPDVLLNSSVDVKSTLHGILWIDHQLCVGEQSSSQDGDCQLLRV